MQAIRFERGDIECLGIDCCSGQMRRLTGDNAVPGLFELRTASESLFPRRRGSLIA